MAPQEGTGKTGNTWKKQEFVLETEGQYPKKVCISIWGDKHDANLLQVGNTVNVSFDIESREYNGKWYTDVKAWKLSGATAGTSSTPTPSPSNSFEGIDVTASEKDNDLPF